MMLKKFKKDDFEIYQSWFDDEVLNLNLGPRPDENWLNTVLNDSRYKYHSAFVDSKLGGVIGITIPTKEQNYYVISEIAVNPIMREQGMGKTIIEAIIKEYSPQASFDWVCFVAIKNSQAQVFFAKLGWGKDEYPDQHGMTRFILNKREFYSA